MDMMKIAILGISAVLLAILIRDWKPQFSMLISLSVCIVIFFGSLSRIECIVELFRGLTDQIAMKEMYLIILLKIMGIAYIADFSSALCKEAGYAALAGQIDIFGKISVLTVSIPVVSVLLDTISEFLQ